MKLKNTIVTSTIVTITLIIILLNSYSAIIPQTQSVGDTYVLTSTAVSQNTTTNTGESFSQATPFTITLSPTYTINSLISVGNLTQNFTFEENITSYTENFTTENTHPMQGGDNNYKDGVWDGAGSATIFTVGTALFNYSILGTNTSAIWQVRVGNIYTNYSMNENDCFIDPIQVKAESIDGGAGKEYAELSCYNGTAFKLLGTTSTVISLSYYEDAMWWGDRNYDDLTFISNNEITIWNNNTLSGNVVITYGENGTSITGNDIPLGSLFGSSGVIFIIVMAGLLFIIIKFINFKNN